MRHIGITKKIIINTTIVEPPLSGAMVGKKHIVK
jgi:hypothetical protein